jgi:hypothetical protein
MFVPDSLALRRGQTINRRNALVAAFCGCGPAALLAYLLPPTPGMWLAGLAAGFLWANFFEYALHRWLLHWPGSYPGESHMLHHRSLGQPEEPLYVNLGGRPGFVVAMFVGNGVPVALLDRFVFSQAGFFFHGSFAPGMLVAFSIYFIVTEHIHWRFHMGGWLPKSLRQARARHLAHHQHPDQDFSIFFPLFDRLLRTASR